ncbi:MAG: thiamine-phosphate kinase [Gammaproteobacteria bacterium]|nr:thiamine-phosphate kinase [Gammaproteobacteria bacterium]MCG3144381.1 Thiamine-monophosphate kinase [Gammaproteobacteria bacterium]
MSVSEFELIDRYFRRGGARRDDVAIGIGDDGAVLRPRPGHELVLVTDTIVAGVHFPVTMSAGDVGYRALAVNLSDLAAMGAEPAWCSLALTVPQADETWLHGFADGLLGLAERFDMQLVGGDTTRGPLTVTVTAHGWVPAGQSLRRAGAGAGDGVYVTGTLGDAAAGLRVLVGETECDADSGSALTRRFLRPEPRVALGQFLRGIASSAIDVSDGLAADLRHVLEASGRGAEVDLARLPISASLRACERGDAAIERALGGGDDYELCFTVPPGRESALGAWRAQDGVPLTRIGTVVARPGLRFVEAGGRVVDRHIAGYAHF